MLRGAAMKTKYGLIQPLFWLVLFLCSSALPSYAQETCIQQAQIGIQPGAWETVKTYFASLSVTNQVTAKRSRLTLLRAEIVSLESWKERIIEIVDAHIGGGYGDSALNYVVRRSIQRRDVSIECHPDPRS